MTDPGAMPEAIRAAVADLTSPSGRITLTKDEARWLAVAAQRLDRRPPARSPRNRAMMLEVIRAIGTLQLDSISVISRTHETVMWSRIGPYDPAELNALHYPDGALFEYLVHAAALAPIEIFPYVRRRMASYGLSRQSEGSWHAENLAVFDRVMEVGHAQGTVSSRDFERADGPAPDPWTWYGGKPERQALEALWATGDLMVLRRENFQRVYAPTELAHPGIMEVRIPTDEEQRRWFVLQSVAGLGVAAPAWVTDYYRTGGQAYVPNKEAAGELRTLGNEGWIVPVDVDGVKGPLWIGHKEVTLLGELRAGRRRPTLTTFLSPFDNLTWHRGRVSALFDFNYLLECYVPAPKRRYGYYNLSILHKGRLVGRLDPSYDRKARVLTIRGLHLEPTVRPSDALAASIAWALHDLLVFLKGQDIGILRSDPPEFGPMVQRAIETQGYTTAPA